MTLKEILQGYDSSLLDQISADKIDEVVSLRLPTPVAIQEIVAALSSLSYISDKVVYAKPPTYAFLQVLLHTKENTMEIEGFREKVFQMVEELSVKAQQLKQNSSLKNYQLYTNILHRAWENDGVIDKSESHILEFVKIELNIWDREHFVLGHHPSILKLWDLQQEYQLVRHQLLTSGIVLVQGNNYVMAEETARQIRRCFGMELHQESYTRLLNGFTREELAIPLESWGLPVSGTKPEIIHRVQELLIPPSQLLDCFAVEMLREYCRRNNCPVSGTKAVVIGNIINFFDQELDIKVEEVMKEEVHLPSQPELRELNPELFTRILNNLSNQQLYDILYQSYLPTSGTKEEKVNRISNSPWSERSVFNRLRKEDLSYLCRRFGLPVSGAKPELVDRLLDLNLVLPVEQIDLVVEKQEVQKPVSETVVNSETKSIEQTPVVDQATPLPVGFAQVAEMYPDLGQDEKVVLAIIREAGSLSEQELERVVLRHHLGWFLYRANMAELIARLKRSKRYPLRIKSLQSINIYQWVGDNVPSEPVSEKKVARDIIDALRHGVVPKSNLDRLVVGQQGARKHLTEILGELDQTKSHFKFIRGQYGAGKTFLCSWLKEHALENEYVISFLNISNDQPLSDLPVFFSGMINGLRTPEKTDAGALVDILESWLYNIHKRTAQLEGIPLDGQHAKKLHGIVKKSIETELSGLSDIEPGFAQAIRSFYEAKVEGNGELSQNAIAWITGSRSLSAQALREIGVKGELEPHHVFQRMRALLQIIHGARYKGLLLLVDELELVRKFPHARQREQALETLRLLIDEVGKTGLPGCLLVFTGTDEFFEDERYGLRSYEALAERVLTPLSTTSLVSMRQPIIQLESLDKERLAQVIFKIRELYGVAYSCEAANFADDETVHQLLESWTQLGTESTSRKPRPILREFIQLLDLCEENKGLKVGDFLRNSMRSPESQPSHSLN